MPSTFLIVGADRLSRLVLHGFIEFLNPDWQVFHASSSEEALSIAASTKLDLVSIDDSIISSDGIDLARAIRAIQPDVRIGILNGEDETFHSDTNFGAEVCVINKPVTLDAARELSKHFVDIAK